jgi:hypothetical protein
MPRQATTLYQRVLENSFRADRYGKLLAGPPLPAKAPKPVPPVPVPPFEWDWTPEP